MMPVLPATIRDSAMTISELQSNESLRRREFPVCENQIYLAHAGVCPLPRRVLESTREYLRESSLGDQETPGLPAMIASVRVRAAEMIGAAADEIALVGPTSLALNFIANGLDWRPGDNVAAYVDDYPSNVYPWMALADRGVALRPVEPSEPGRIGVEEVIAAVDDRTRLVALASCHFLSGYRIDHAAIGRALHERGILFCLDAIQTLGAFPTRVEDVDFLAADAHKWLLGPCAAGILYVKRSLHETLKPTVHGWNNVRCPGFVAQSELAYRRGAHRYEVGSYNCIGLAGLDAALGQALEIGVAPIAADLADKRAWLTEALQARGYDVVHATAGREHTGGIVTCSRQGTDMNAVHTALQSRGVVASLRTDRAGRHFLRFSPHYYNTADELRRVVEAMPS